MGTLWIHKHLNNPSVTHAHTPGTTHGSDTAVLNVYSPFTTENKWSLYIYIIRKSTLLIGNKAYWPKFVGLCLRWTLNGDCLFEQKNYSVCQSQNNSFTQISFRHHSSYHSILKNIACKCRLLAKSVHFHTLLANYTYTAIPVFTSIVHTCTVHFGTVLSICIGRSQQCWEVYWCHREQGLYFL